jgi:hypothetical protein
VSGDAAGVAADIEGFLRRLVRLDPNALVRVQRAGGRAALWARLPWDVLVVRTVADPGGAAGSDLTVAAVDWLAAGQPAGFGGGRTGAGLGESGGSNPAVLGESDPAADSGPVAGDRPDPALGAGLLLRMADLATLPRRDRAWRAPMPVAPPVVLETVPAAVVRRLADAAAETLQSTTRSGVHGRAVGERVVRDALLDHVPIVVTVASESGEPVKLGVPQRLVQAVSRMAFLDAADSPVQVVHAGPVRSGGWIGLAAAGGTAWWRGRSPLTITPARDLGTFPGP